MVGVQDANQPRLPQDREKNRSQQYQRVKVFNGSAFDVGRFVWEETQQQRWQEWFKTLL